MADSDPAADEPSPPDASEPLALRNPWVAFLVPFVVYLAAGALEPSPPQPGQSAETPSTEAVEDADQSEDPRAEAGFGGYALGYSLKIAATIAALAVAWPAYRRIPLRVSSLALVFGVVGAAVWIVLCQLNLEARLVDALGGPEAWWVQQLGLGPRPSLDFWAMFADSPVQAGGFLAVRLIGLALVVPIIEEMFLRGWLMRFVQSEQWWTVPIGYATPLAIAVGTLVPMVYHPEKLAAAVWFSMITLLMLKTRNIWDCVAAHMVTNLLLGVYVLMYAKWELW